MDKSIIEALHGKESSDINKFYEENINFIKALGYPSADWFRRAVVNEMVKSRRVMSRFSYNGRTYEAGEYVSIKFLESQFKKETLKSAVRRKLFSKIVYVAKEEENDAN